MAAGRAHNHESIPRIAPGPGQESVWDYPRPPRVERSPRHIQVIFNGVMIADSTRAERVLETSHAPNYYLPRDDVRMEYFVPSPRRTICEWKGQAEYFDVTVGGANCPKRGLGLSGAG